MKNKFVYLDNAATTPILAEAAAAITRADEELFFNPSAAYGQALEVKKRLDDASKKLLESLGAKGYGIVFSSGATEANNLIIQGGMKKNKQLIISAGEHPSVYECAKTLKNNGTEVLYAPLNKDGTTDLNWLRANVTSKTGLVSIMHVSNETGAINNLTEIVKIVKKVNSACIIHSDGAQAIGKTDVNLAASGVDAYTTSAHKFGGPKGVGALIVKNGIGVKPIVFGGGQQRGLRSGTENTAGILGMCKAAEIAIKGCLNNRLLYTEFKKIFLETLDKNRVEYKLNSCLNCVPGIVSLSFTGLKGEVLLHMLEEHDILIGTGSACSSKAPDNRTLKGMGRSNGEINGAIRISFGVCNTSAEVRQAAAILADAVKKLEDSK
ncbi:MAG: cysteine desulfurase [Firmicutes bacterium]|nr:cysteine desulfurase [Bacillota bacterium]